MRWAKCLCLAGCLPVPGSSAARWSGSGHAPGKGPARGPRGRRRGSASVARQGRRCCSEARTVSATLRPRPRRPYPPGLPRCLQDPWLRVACGVLGARAGEQPSGAMSCPLVWRTPRSAAPRPRHAPSFHPRRSPAWSSSRMQYSVTFERRVATRPLRCGTTRAVSITAWWRRMPVGSSRCLALRETEARYHC